MPFEIFNSQNLTKIKENLPDFYTWFKCVAENVEGCFGSLACSQIWLNLHVDHHHFGCITKLTPPPKKKKKKKKIKPLFFFFFLFFFLANFFMNQKWKGSQ